MVKPINVTTPTCKQIVKINSLIDKSAAKIRINNLIKEFEEIYKSQSNNEALKKHIENLKESLKLYQ